MHAEDVEAAAATLYEAFYDIHARHNFLPSLFPSVDSARAVISGLLDGRLARCFTAVAGGELVGSTFLTERGATAGIGPVSVAIGRQGGGVGRRLMEALIAAAGPTTSLRLTQSLFNTRSFALYHSLGFVPRDIVAWLEGGSLPTDTPPPAGTTVRPWSEADLPAVLRLDQELCGLDRAPDIASYRTSGRGWLAEQDGRLLGYVVVLGHRHPLCGPATARDEPTLRALLAAAASDAPGAEMRILVSQTSLLEWLRAAGYRVRFFDSFMVRGAWRPPAGATLLPWFPETF